MVQRPPLQQREYLVRDSNNWHERPYVDVSSENRFAVSQPVQQPIHPRCLPVEAALKDCAGLSVKEFALFVLDENGEEKTYTSTSLTPYQRRIFSDKFKQEFRRNVRRTSQASFSQSAYSHDGSMYGDLDTERDMRPRHSGEESSSDSPRRYQRQSRSEDTEDGSANGTLSRKRHRSQYTGSDDTPMPVQIVKTQQLVIGDEAEVDKFYNIRFKDMQQFSCKIMGKAFVKLVEPKKQTHHPYTKGAAKAPPWWPETEGENHVRHREPDHLLKAERVRLLIHILKLIVEPPMKQCPAVQKLGLNVKQLEEATMEALNNFFNDKDHPENAQKRVYLKEIFKVARAQERFKNGEIDATTRIPVQFGDRNAQEGSDEDDVDEGIKDEDQEEEPVSATISMTSSDNLSPSMLQTSSLQPQEEEFFRNRPLTMRYNTQPQGSMEENHSYNDSYITRNMNGGFPLQVSPTAQDPLRRPFPSPNFQPSQNLYPWTHNVVNNTAQSQFFVQPQGTLPQPSYLPRLHALHQPSTPHHYNNHDGLPNGRFDSTPALGNQLRTGSLGHPHQLSSHGFEYMQENSYGHNENELKNDS